MISLKSDEILLIYYDIVTLTKSQQGNFCLVILFVKETSLKMWSKPVFHGLEYSSVKSSVAV